MNRVRVTEVWFKDELHQLHYQGLAIPEAWCRDEEQVAARRKAKNAAKRLRKERRNG